MHARPSMAVEQARVMGIRVRREVLPRIPRMTTRQASEGWRKEKTRKSWRGIKTDGRITFPFICKVRQFRWIDEPEFDG